MPKIHNPLCLTLITLIFKDPRFSYVPYDNTLQNKKIKNDLDYLS